MRDNIPTEKETTAMNDFKAEIAAAMQCLDNFIATMNAGDAEGHDDCFNFPSVRLASNNLVVFERGRDKAWVKKTGSFSDWARSDWDKREILHAGADKVHINTRFVRYRHDGSVLGAFDSIYVVTKQDGHWGIKIRSSFAP
jgi:hypothetical protein